MGPGPKVFREACRDQLTAILFCLEASPSLEECIYLCLHVRSPCWVPCLPVRTDFGHLPLLPFSSYTALTTARFRASAAIYFTYRPAFRLRCLYTLLLSLSLRPRAYPKARVLQMEKRMKETLENFLVRYRRRFPYTHTVSFNRRTLPMAVELDSATSFS